MGFPIYQDFESHIPRSLISSNFSDKDIVRLGLDLIKSKIDDFVRGTSSNIGSKASGVIGETFQYSPMSGGITSKDEPPKNMESVLIFLNTIISDTINAEKRRALITKATGTGLLKPMNDKKSWYSFSDDTYMCQISIDMDETGIFDDSRCPGTCPPPVFMQARAKDGAFILLLDTATDTLSIMAPSSVKKATQAFESGLSTSEKELVQSVCRHIQLEKIDVLYHEPKNLKENVRHTFRVAQESFMSRVREARPGTFIPMEVWKDLIDMYTHEMTKK
jgi:hypothetical protein